MIEFEAFLGIIGLVVLALFIYGPWQSYCVDHARQCLFAQRATLFDIADVGRISFNDAAYTLTRQHIERLIRFAHNLTWVRFLVLLPFVRDVDAQPFPEAASAISSIENKQTRLEIRQIYDQSGRIMLRMIVAKSPLLLGLSLLGGWVFRGVKFIARKVGRGNWQVQRVTARMVEIIQQAQVIIRAEADSSNA